jgi:gamma-glutamyl-gamma-aminobutyrate hydrolase PuuD
MEAPDAHISNVIHKISALGLYQMHGWPINKWEKILLANNCDAVIEWLAFAEKIIAVKRQWTPEYNRLEMQKELELFPKRLELCHMAYRYQESLKDLS